MDRRTLCSAVRKLGVGRRTLGETQPERREMGAGPYKAGRKKLVLETGPLALRKALKLITAILAVIYISIGLSFW
jgi:hypothetical protein